MTERDREQGTPQERLGGDEDDGLNKETGGYDAPTDQERQGGEDDANEAAAPGAGS